MKHDTIELVANQMYDKLITMFNNDRKRFGIQKGEPVLNPIRKYDNFKLADNGKISHVHKRMVIDLGNINERLKSPWEIRRIGVSELKLMGFVNPCKQKYKKGREKVRILNEDLNERSKAIESSSTTDPEPIEMIEVTSKDIDTTIKDVEQDTTFIEPGE